MNSTTEAAAKVATEKTAESTMTLAYLYDKLVNVSLIIVKALLLLIIGLIVIKYIMKGVDKWLKKSKMDETLKPFLHSTISVALKVFLILAVIGVLGVETTSVVAVLGGASLAIGLAFQGALSNLAAGVILLLIKPLRAGDYIEVLGKTGTVTAVQFFSTKLLTLDNKVVFIPNSKVLGSELTNFSMMDKRRVDQVYGVDYDSDIDTVKRVLREEIDALPKALKTPEPFVALAEHGDSSVNYVIRVWTETADYWDVHFALLENIKKRFDKENINIPYPVIDLRNSK